MNLVSGIRYPRLGFMTKGAGLADDGIPPEPYETFAYDSALLDAKIENFNVIPYTSVLPLGLGIKDIDADYDELQKKYFHHGGVLEVIMAGVGADHLSKDGTTNYGIGTGLGIIRNTMTKDGQTIGGFAAEYVEIYSEEITPPDVQKRAEAQLKKSLDHELSIRDLDAVSDYEYIKINSVQFKDGNGKTWKHAYCLSCLGFLVFENVQLL